MAGLAWQHPIPLPEAESLDFSRQGTFSSTIVFHLAGNQETLSCKRVRNGGHRHSGDCNGRSWSGRLPTAVLFRQMERCSDCLVQSIAYRGGGRVLRQQLAPDWGNTGSASDAWAGRACVCVQCVCC